MIDGFRTFRYYKMIHLHFSHVSKYDVFEYKGKINDKFETYLKRPDYKLFEALGKVLHSNAQAIEFMVANVIYDNPKFIYKLTDDCVNNYLLYIKRKESISNVVHEDLNTLDMEMDKIGISNPFDFTNGIPLFFQLFLSKQISIESVFIIDSLLNVLPTNHSIFNKEIYLIKQIKHFCTYDQSKILKTFNKFNYLQGNI